MINSIRIFNRSPLRPQIFYTYLSFIDKPIISIPINSVVESSAQFLQYLSTQMSTCSEVSVLMGGIAFRISIEVFSQCIKSMKHRDRVEDKLPSIYEDMEINQNKRFLTRWIDKIFVLDMVRDYRFNVRDRLKNHASAYPIILSSTFIARLFLNCTVSAMQAYLMINFMRGCNLVITHPQFNSFNANTAYLPSLGMYDPHFYTPILVMLLTYHLLRRSRHPFFINMRRPQNKLSCWNLAFMTGLAMVAAPGIYHFGYMGLVIGHCSVRMMKRLSKFK